MQDLNLMATVGNRNITDRTEHNFVFADDIVACCIRMACDLQKSCARRTKPRRKGASYPAGGADIALATMSATT